MRATWGLFATLSLLHAYASEVRADELRCREDERLTETAAALLLGGDPIRPSTLLARARAHGFDGVSVHARESEDTRVLGEWLAGLRAGNPGELVCGEARSEGRRLLLASVRAGRLERRGDSLRGELAAGFERPSLVLEREDGSLQSLPLSADELRTGVRVVELASVRRAQLLAESESGPRPVAELALRDEKPAHEEEQEGVVLSPEALLARLSEARRAARVGALRENRLLAESAQRHAARLCAAGKLVHRLEGEDPASRLAQEHIAARSVGEALARAGSSSAAWRVLLASPSHRLALARRDFTDVGLGQAFDRKGQVCLVVLLAGWPRRTP